MVKGKGAREVGIWRVENSHCRNEQDQVVVEVSLTICLNDQEIVTFFCSPWDHKYLALGFLFGEGLLGGTEDLKAITFDQQRGIVCVQTKNPGNDLPQKLYGRRTITSGYGREAALDPPEGEAAAPAPSLSGKTLLTLMHDLQERALLFKRTGGVHNAALADTKQILVYNEDIGRHNAIDKIVGECLIRGISPREKILLSSGRLSAEIIVKGAKAGLPVIVSRSAPTSLAVDLADQAGITLVGFARGNRFNIYTCKERII